MVGMSRGGVGVGSAGALAEVTLGAVRGGPDSGLVGLAGGEPLLQLDPALVDALHAKCLSIALETKGSLPCPAGVDWICVSPKGAVPVVQRSGQELKLVFPQPGVNPAAFETWDFKRFLLQPMDGPRLAENTQAAIDYCLSHPRWRLSVQTHKALGIP